jgi:hypothetical protein
MDEAALRHSQEDFTIPRAEIYQEKAIAQRRWRPIFYAKSHYTRNLIYKCELFEVLAICLNVLLAAFTIIATRIAGW